MHFVLVLKPRIRFTRRGSLRTRENSLPHVSRARSLSRFWNDDHGHHDHHTNVSQSEETYIRESTWSTVEHNTMIQTTKEVDTKSRRTKKKLTHQPTHWRTWSQLRSRTHPCRNRSRWTCQTSMSYRSSRSARSRKLPELGCFAIPNYIHAERKYHNGINA